MNTWLSRVRFWLLGAVLGGFSMGAQATLIGDDIDICHYFPDIGTVYNCVNDVVVQAGAGDVTNPTGVWYNVDVEDSSFFLDFLATATWTTTSFNGLVLQDLDWVGMEGLIVGLIIETNMAGWDDSRASFTADSVALNMNGLSFDADTFFNVILLTRHGIPTPAPLLLLAAGLLALRRIRR
ncbi:MAG: hypothetical protein HYV16_05625 [Gammaproteobacteria bacterium]|nr:hypothetical protein [Gammaproteobacteria bacterium]